VNGSLSERRAQRIGSVKTAWVATCRRAGITGLRFHDLRRSFACSLLESGAGLHDVRDFLGHTDITTTSKYLAATPVRLRAALDRMEGTPDPATDRHAEPPADLPGQMSALVN
jgi:integrase